MSKPIESADLVHEENLVWLEDIETLDYVRQSLERVHRRRGKPPYRRPGRLVGYAELLPDAKASRASGSFIRRVFWLAPHDRDQQPDGFYAAAAPSEAVDPRTVAPGEVGDKTERSQGGPLSPTGSHS
ncbi:DUF6009 family protein [Nonomuraea sp. NPDC049400]|uniref:DUF6009 family protein n=1 Tax=Nonomuraea sp. NPDC049400 TaxID=3364352 RepID=UPI0037A0CF0D